MTDLIKELDQAISEKGISPEVASKFIECSARQVRRWLKGEARPSIVYRRAIRRGIEQIKKIREDP